MIQQGHKELIMQADNINNTKGKVGSKPTILALVSEGINGSVWGDVEIPSDPQAQQAAWEVVELLGERWRSTGSLYDDDGIVVCCAVGVGIYYARDLWADAVYRLIDGD